MSLEQTIISNIKAAISSYFPLNWNAYDINNLDMFTGNATLLHNSSGQGFQIVNAHEPMSNNQLVSMQNFLNTTSSTSFSNVGEVIDAGISLVQEKSLNLVEKIYQSFGADKLKDFTLQYKSIDSNQGAVLITHTESGKTLMVRNLHTGDIANRNKINIEKFINNYKDFDGRLDNSIDHAGPITSGADYLSEKMDAVGNSIYNFTLKPIIDVLHLKEATSAVYNTILRPVDNVGVSTVAFTDDTVSNAVGHDETLQFSNSKTVTQTVKDGYSSATMRVDNFVKENVNPHFGIEVQENDTRSYANTKADQLSEKIDHVGNRIYDATIGKFKNTSTGESMTNTVNAGENKIVEVSQEEAQTINQSYADFTGEVERKGLPDALSTYIDAGGRKAAYNEYTAPLSQTVTYAHDRITETTAPVDNAVASGFNYVDNTIGSVANYFSGLKSNFFNYLTQSNESEHVEVRTPYNTFQTDKVVVTVPNDLNTFGNQNHNLLLDDMNSF